MKNEIKVGDIFNKWTVLYQVDNTNKYYCQCGCGNFNIISKSALLNNKNKQCKNCRNRKHFIKDNTIINGWTIIKEDIENKGSGVFYFCKCNSCHKDFRIRASYLINNRQKQCPKCTRNIIDKQKWKGVGELSQTYINLLKIGAKKRNLEFTTNIEELWELFLEQNRRCFLTNYELKLTQNGKKQYASIDRIDNKLGYIKGNMKWIIPDLNFIRGKMSYGILFEWCKLIFLKTEQINSNLDNEIIPDKKWKTILRNYSTNKKDLQFNINRQDAQDLFNQQKGLCAITNLALTFTNGINTASLDRIDSNKGYTLDNIQWIHKTINFLKQDYNNKYFISLCKDVYLNLLTKENLSGS